MKKNSIVLILILLSVFLKSQNPVFHTTDDIDKWLKNYREKKNNRTKQDEKNLLLAKETSENMNYVHGVLKAGFTLVAFYGSQDKYKESAEMGNSLKKWIKDDGKDNDLKCEIYRRTALEMGHVGVRNASIEDFKIAIHYGEGIENENLKLALLSLCYQNMNVNYVDEVKKTKEIKDIILRNLLKSNQLLKQINDQQKTEDNINKYNMIVFNNIRLGIFYLEQADAPGCLKLAEKYLTDGYKLIDRSLPDTQIMLLNQLSWLYMERKDHNKTIEYANRALKLEKIYPDPYHRVESYEFLSTAYGALRDKRTPYFMEKYSSLKDSLRIIDKNSVDDINNKMTIEKDKEQRESMQEQWIIAGGVLGSISIIVVLLWIREKRIMKSKYDMIVSKLKEETINQSEKAPKPEIYHSAKNNIANETEKSLVLKLEVFEADELFLNKDISLTSLANSFSTNPRYLTDVIKKYRSQNFNNYINALRVNYIIHKLYNEPKYRDYKISYLAEVSGFVSYQVFVLAFKNLHGVTPSYFIQNLKLETSSAI